MQALLFRTNCCDISVSPMENCPPHRNGALRGKS